MKIEVIFGKYFCRSISWTIVLYIFFLLICYGIFCWNCSIKIIIKRWFSICLFHWWRSFSDILLFLNRPVNVLGSIHSIFVWLHILSSRHTIVSIVICNCHQTRNEESTKQKQKRNEKKMNEWNKERNCPITFRHIQVENSSISHLFLIYLYDFSMTQICIIRKMICVLVFVLSSVRWTFLCFSVCACVLLPSGLSLFLFSAKIRFRLCCHI